MQQNNTQTQDESLDSQIFKCPGCGNFLYYDPQSKKMKCDYCNTTVDTQEVGMAQELPYNDGVEQGLVGWGGVKSVKCKSCGAISVLPDYEVVSSCPFCNASNIVDSDEIEGLQPNGILPFKIAKEHVPIVYENWLKSKKLAPNKLKKEAKRHPIPSLWEAVRTDVPRRGRDGIPQAVTSTTFLTICKWRRANLLRRKISENWEDLTLTILLSITINLSAVTAPSGMTKVWTRVGAKQRV